MDQVSQQIEMDNLNRFNLKITTLVMMRKNK